MQFHDGAGQRELFGCKAIPITLSSHTNDLVFTSVAQRTIFKVFSFSLQIIFFLPVEINKISEFRLSKIAIN